MVTILGIESSCDDTSAAVIRDGNLLSNVISSQEVHKSYGGVVPELASRAHQQNIIPVVHQALKEAGVLKNDIHAVAFTKGPGLLGSLMVGASFAKGFAMSLNIPLIEVNHLQGHVLAHFIKQKKIKADSPKFPFLCLLVSGGHTQIVLVNDFLKMKIIGKTIDDAAGEAFDKCAKIIGFSYPGGPQIDKMAKFGNPLKFKFSKPQIEGLNFSFSGLKTGFLYFIRDNYIENKNFINENISDICASIQHTIIEILIEKLIKASEETKINEIAIAGGVAANSGLRNKIIEEGKKRNWNVYIPKIIFTTDNAAMIAITGYYKYSEKQFSDLNVSPLARMDL
ncbi:MAG: tRNA (adenosine(37)-N6)-threonylcarbamoyltransferase complex transferase subunit TsaD [Bacteroidales bacterium]|nr:tRNA (adenosine(37)-N6)-threonylcarbamoyltransferase complex transferase subunit TsaD [Bacteroidales bacterium]